MNIINSRINGWAAQKWDDSLGMYLYVYFPFDGASVDTYNYVQNNIDLYATASVPTDVSWSAASAEYVPPAISADWYDGEVGATVIGGPPVEEEVTEPEETPVPESQPAVEETPVPEPVPEEPVVTEEPAPEEPGAEG
jgi:hypothetical protein